MSLSEVKFSRTWFQSTVEKSEWEKHLKDVPEFDISKLKRYLTESRNKTFDKEGMRAYKSLKAYKYFEEGYVQRISSAQKHDIYFVKAEVMASMARRIYTSYVCMSKEGDVHGGSCDCVAGKGEACSHIAALLFAVDDYVAKGFKELPNRQGVTDKLCEWNKPAKRTVEPKTIHNIRVVKQEHGKIQKERQTLNAVDFDPRQPNNKTVNQESLDKLTQALILANPTCGFVKYNTESGNTDREYQNHRDEHIDEQSASVYILQLPPSIGDIKSACECVKNSLEVSPEEIKQIDQQTVEQSLSDKWYAVRRHRLTASVFHSVICRREKTDPKALLKSLLYNKIKSTAAMQFGIHEEDNSSERFTTAMRDTFKGSEVIIKKRGFVIDSTKNYLGASVDRVATISREEIIVEFKNPLSTWEFDLITTARKLPCLKIDENDKICLNQRHSYYTQIQGQMAILNIHQCYFVLCTKMEIFIELVKFNQKFWENAANKLDIFYNNIFLPEIVYPKVKYGLAAVDLGTC